MNKFKYGWVWNKVAEKKANVQSLLDSFNRIMGV